MVVATYTRSPCKCGCGKWNADNPDRVDLAGEQVHVAREIEAAIPGWKFTVHCSGDVMQICSNSIDNMPKALVATLDDIVKAHCDNTP
jgi:hypothetical protein